MPPQRGPGGAAPTSLRKVKLTRNFTGYAEGSVLIEQGRTRVICTVSVAEGVPRFLSGRNQGWVTAEYSMLPRSTHTRRERESRRGRPDSRSLEISRLIGRSLRGALDLSKLGEHTLIIDCDVIQADGGTRCAAITGGMVALADAARWLQRKKRIREDPLRYFVAAVSVGMVAGKPVLDLDYELDSRAQVDLNVVMTDDGRYLELQGTAEGEPFTDRQLSRLKKLAAEGIRKLIRAQKKALRK